jgi:metal-responsive CopG/Arc/MetJ family transcriptional regulator
MDVKPTLVRLPEGTAERIDVVAGKNRRAEFIRDAVEKELVRRERDLRKADKPLPPGGPGVRLRSAKGGDQ